MRLGVCVCVCLRARVRVCVRVCTRACASLSFFFCYHHHTMSYNIVLDINTYLPGAGLDRVGLPVGRALSPLSFCCYNYIILYYIILYYTYLPGAGLDRVGLPVVHSLSFCCYNYNYIILYYIILYYFILYIPARRGPRPSGPPSRRRWTAAAGSRPTPATPPPAAPPASMNVDYHMLELCSSCIIL